MTAGLDAEASASLLVQVGRLTTAIEAQQRSAQETLNRFPRFIKQSFNATNVAGTCTVSLGGPDLGYMWTVRRLFVADAAAVSNAATGVCTFYASTASPTILPQNGEWYFPSLPNAATFGGRQIVLGYSENLYAVITGGGSTQQLTFGIAVELYPAPGPNTAAV
jgi:hypothetical protein